MSFAFLVIPACIVEEEFYRKSWTVVVIVSLIGYVVVAKETFRNGLLIVIIRRVRGGGVVEGCSLLWAISVWLMCSRRFRGIEERCWWVWLGQNGRKKC